jgi:hypothetical protein
MTATKLFISHASEDKADFVEPLVGALQAAGFEVWYDKYELTMGDSLLRKIGEGLSRCDFGVVVLSPSFFKKKWPQAELDGLFTLETTERKVILPIWKDVGEEEVKKFSVMLAGRLGAPTVGGVHAVVGEIRRAVEASQRTTELSKSPSPLDRLKKLEQNVVSEKKSRALANSYEGVRLTGDAATELISSLLSQVEELIAGTSVFKLSVKSERPDALAVNGPHRMSMVVRYSNEVTNSVERAVLRIHATQATDPWEDPSKFRLLYKLELHPCLDADGTVTWKSSHPALEFSPDRVSEHFQKTLIDLLEKLQAERDRR